jgi:hypothetical protein
MVCVVSATWRRHVGMSVVLGGKNPRHNADISSKDFHHERDGDVSRSHCQSHTMDGIAIGRSPTSNAMLVYNPRTKCYYEPDSYRLDPYCLPSSVYPTLMYDGGLFCSLYRDDDVPNEELYPLGMQVEQVDPTTNMLLVGTVIMDIPLLTAPSGSPSYQILFDNGNLASIPLADMPSVIPALPLPVSTPEENSSSLLPPFLSINSRITYEHEGAYHKAFLHTSLVGYTASVSRLTLRRNLRTGESISPIFLSIGWISVPKAFRFLVTLHICLFGRPLLRSPRFWPRQLLNLHLIWLRVL